MVLIHRTALRALAGLRAFALSASLFGQRRSQPGRQRTTHLTLLTCSGAAAPWVKRVAGCDAARL